MGRLPRPLLLAGRLGLVDDDRASTQLRGRAHASGDISAEATVIQDMLHSNCHPQRAVVVGGLVPELHAESVRVERVDIVNIRVEAGHLELIQLGVALDETRSP